MVFFLFLSLRLLLFFSYFLFSMFWSPCVIWSPLLLDTKSPLVPWCFPLVATRRDMSGWPQQQTRTSTLGFLFGSLFASPSCLPWLSPLPRSVNSDVAHPHRQLPPCQHVVGTKTWRVHFAYSSTPPSPPCLTHLTHHLVIPTII